MLGGREDLQTGGQKDSRTAMGHDESRKKKRVFVSVTFCDVLRDFSCFQELQGKKLTNAFL